MTYKSGWASQVTVGARFYGDGDEPRTHDKTVAQGTAHAVDGESLLSLCKQVTVDPETVRDTWPPLVGEHCVRCDELAI